MMAVAWRSSLLEVVADGRVCWSEFGNVIKNRDGK